MTIEQLATDPTLLRSLLGGALIGVSAVMYMALNGRIAGISGQLSRMLPPWQADSSSDRAAAFAFIVGLLLAVPLFLVFGKGAPEHALHTPMALIAVAGLLVGIGTGIGSGCTSGHGVCGISRLSTRSIVATVTFIVAGMLTVFVSRHVLGWGLTS